MLSNDIKCTQSGVAIVEIYLIELQSSITPRTRPRNFTLEFNSWAFTCVLSFFILGIQSLYIPSFRHYGPFLKCKVNGSSFIGHASTSQVEWDI